MEKNDIKNILREEGNTTLKLIDPDFYNKVNQYIRELENELKKIENLRSIEYKMLEDELQSALEDIEVIFTRRIRKIVTHAVSNAFSNNPSSQVISKLIPVEQVVFNSVLNAIQFSRDELLKPILDPSFKPDTIKKQEIESEKSNRTDKNIINKECILVRILKDIPTFKGINDRNYSLSANDIITLPMPHARVLIKKNVALKIF